MFFHGRVLAFPHCRAVSEHSMSAANKLKDWISQQKDNSVSLIAEQVLQKYLEPYGRLLGFALNTRQSRASLKVLLNGEAEPIMIDILEYELIQDATGTYVTVKQAKTSRDWLSALVQQFLIGRRFPIPEKYATYAKMLL
jgi:hypothetical protein